MLSSHLRNNQHLISLLALAALAMAARIHITLLDFNSLLNTFLVDDAFYDFKVVANFAHTHRITYDGEGLTNGFHPLWMLIITPFYTAANHGLDFVTRVMWIMLAIQTLSVLMLYLNLSRLRAGWWLSFAGAAILALHSTMVDFESNGLETSINTLALLALLYSFIGVYQGKDFCWKRYAWFGGAAATAFLARTDNAIALLVLFAILFCNLFSGSTDSPANPIRKPLFALVGSGCIAAVLVSPWLLWNLVNFGSIVQTSGKVESIFIGEPHFDWQATVASLMLSPISIHNATTTLVKLFFYPDGYHPVLSAVLLAVWVIALYTLLRPDQKHLALRAAAWFSFAVFLVFCYHASLRHFVRSWYSVAAGLALFAGFFALLAHMQTQKSLSMAANVVITAWLASVLWLHSPTKLAGASDFTSPHIVGSNWINSHLPADAVIGSMNSGILGYLVDRKVINLDGVMDIRSLQAHWQKKETAYLHERGIGYLVDNEGSLRIFCKENPFHTCETLYTFGSAINPGKVVKINAK
ncbi:MAG TPA: hypothetical protein PLF22_04990 [Pseudomonadales bacterium]|nr:hypothetical protein [Pseudomonadales bacterium]